MDDLISRQAAIDAIWEVRITPGGELFNAIKRAQEELIKQLPSAGPERKKGKWEWSEFISFNEQLKLPSCSLCHFVFTSRYNYCPNCGAEMEGE